MISTKELDRYGTVPNEYVIFRDRENPWWEFKIPYVVWEKEGRPEQLVIKVGEE